MLDTVQMSKPLNLPFDQVGGASSVLIAEIRMIGVYRAQNLTRNTTPTPCLRRRLA